MQTSDHAERPSLARPSRKTRFYFALTMGLVLGAGESPAWAQKGAGDKKALKAQKNEKAEKPFENPDPEWLPPGFQPPPEPLAIMDLDQPIAVKEELTKLKKDFYGKFSKALRDCDLSEQGKLIIKGGLRYKLAEMTLKEKRNDLPRLHRALIQELTTGIGNPGIKPADITATVQFVGQEVFKQIPELFKNNFYVRLHAVMIVSELDYAPAYALLIPLIQAKDIAEDEIEGQPEAVKIAATQGLIRILKFTAPPVKDRTVIAHAMVDELLKSKTHWWYQLRLVEGLRHTTIAVDAGNNGKPFVIEALLAVMKDAERSWVVRAKACYAIGRVPIPAAIKAEDIVTAVADCALQLSNNAAAKPNNPIWKSCFWDVYLAFKPDGTKDKDGKDKDQDAEKRTLGGLLARIKPQAQRAYDLIVPIARAAIHDKAPDPGDVKNLGDFVRERLPQEGPAPINKKAVVPETGESSKDSAASKSTTRPSRSVPVSTGTQP